MKSGRNAGSLTVNVLAMRLFSRENLVGTQPEEGEELQKKEREQE